MALTPRAYSVADRHSKAAGECAPLNEGRSRYTTDNANRVSLVIAERYGTSYAKFVNWHKQWDGSYYEEWQTPTRIGAQRHGDSW